MKELKANIVIPIWIVVCFCILYGIDIFTHQEIEKIKHSSGLHRSMMMQNQTQLLIEAKKKSMVSLALAIGENSSLKDALLNKKYDRISLIDFSNKLKKYTDYHNVWFQLIDTKGNSLYRSWTSKKGDNLTKARYDITQMIVNPQVMSSISTGKFDMTFKAIVPLFKDDTFIGMIEVITHFNSIARELLTDNIDVVFLVDKSYKKQLSNTSFSKIFINEYYVANSNVKKELLNIIEKKGVQYYIDINKNFIFDEENNKFITSLPIPDIHGKDMGYAIIFKNLEDSINIFKIKEIHKNNILNTIFILVIISIITYLLFYRNYNKKLKKSLKETQDAKDKVTTIINSQPSIIVITDGYEIQEVNTKFFEFFSQYKTLEEFKSEYKCICDFFDPNIQDQDYIVSKDKWAEKVLTEPQRIFKVAIRKDNKLYHFIVNAAKKSLEKDKEIIIVTFTDITQQIEKDKILFEQTKMAALGEMIGNIAHQWRQPLSVISTSASGMLMQNEMSTLEKEKINEYGNIINNTAQDLSKTIDNFSDFIENNSKRETYHFKDMIQSFEDLVSVSIKEYHIKLLVNIPFDFVICGLKNELSQCLISLFNNSKDAMILNNLNEKYIKIDSYIEDEMLVILFHDNGGGIDSTIINKVFEPYFTTKHKSQGKGLGLNTVYKLITEGMNGLINVHNEILKIDEKEFIGAQFVIKLPLQ